MSYMALAGETLAAIDRTAALARDARTVVDVIGAVSLATNAAKILVAIPTWVWVGGGVALIYVLYRRRQTAPAPVQAQPAKQQQHPAAWPGFSVIAGGKK